jgi:hypothetical protein
VALAIVAGASFVAGGPAEAAPFISTYLHPIQDYGDGWCRVRVGVDIQMSETDAISFLNHPGQEATARLWGDDPYFDDGLDSLPVAYLWPQAWAGGYSVEYQLYIGCGFLDEDGDGGDEIYAQITFDDFRTGQRHTGNSNVRSGNY